MANLFGILLGSALDRRNGGSGTKGAIEGYLLEGAAKMVAPLVVTFAIGWGVQFIARRAVQAATGREPGTVE